MPSHALPECFNFGQARARNYRKRNVALCEVNSHAIEIVGEERAARASFFPSRTEHEVIHNELAATVEQVVQRYLSLRAIEDVVLLDLLPRKFAALAAEII